jgi:hypothetical protein
MSVFRLLIAGVAFLFCVFAASHVTATGCNLLSFAVDDASTQLKRAAEETDYEAAKECTRRAKSALEDASMMTVMDCKCTAAHMEFDTAASRVNRAQDANDPKDFVNYLNQAIRAFNSGIEALRVCSRGKK